MNSTLFCFLDHSLSTRCLEQPLAGDRVVGWCQGRSAGHVAVLPNPYLLSSWYADFCLCEFLAITTYLFTQIPHSTAALRAWPGAAQGAELAEASFFLFLIFPILVLTSPHSQDRQSKTRIKHKQRLDNDSHSFFCSPSGRVTRATKTPSKISGSDLNMVIG